MSNQFILSYMLFLPLIGALIILPIAKKREQMIRLVGLGFSVLAFLISLIALFNFDSSSGAVQLVTKIVWIPKYNISYYVGIDGISLILVLLTTFLTPLTMYASWGQIKHKVKEFTFFMLLLEMGMLGVFISFDVFLFYIFWEAMLIPMYFIIGIWGGENRIYAAIKFFIYTMAGSLLMLVAIIWLFINAVQNGAGSTDLFDLYRIGPFVPLEIQKWLFLAFTVSFAIKVPLFPFHTWLPDAHVEAPTAGSVILAGILLKMGTYGLLRFSIPLFPQAAKFFAPYISVLAVIGIIYGSLVAMVQKDIKKLVAYSSVAHLGFVVLGLFALTQESVQGAVLQMINHGLSTGALFLLVGVIYDRTHTRQISDYGGIAKLVPVYSTILLIISLSSIGLPGLNGFVGEFLILLGTFKSDFLAGKWFAVFAGTGVILAAVYLLWMYQRVVFGGVKNEKLQSLADMNHKEIFILGSLIVFIVAIGVYPNAFLKLSEQSTAQIIEFTQKMIQR